MAFDENRGNAIIRVSAAGETHVAEVIPTLSGGERDGFTLEIFVGEQGNASDRGLFTVIWQMQVGLRDTALGHRHQGRDGRPE